VIWGRSSAMRSASNRLRAADVRAEVRRVVLREGDKLDAGPHLDDRSRPRVCDRRVVLPGRRGRAAARIRHHVSIGLADEVLYFFLVESGIVFLTAYLVGVISAGAAVALVIPGIATPTAWLQAAGMVAAFLPAMAIVGALIPVHRLLQQRPVSLLGDR
jgi:hypothetical protein